jgi:hypothetical protein
MVNHMGSRRVEFVGMSERDVAQILSNLEKLGLRLSVIRRLDGSLRLDRWRTMSYWSNADEAERLWSEIDPAMMDDIAAFMERSDVPSIIPGVASGTERQDQVL